MFAKKLRRVAGLVLALAVVLGGAGLAAEHANESKSATQFSTLISEWD